MRVSLALAVLLLLPCLGPRLEAEPSAPPLQFFAGTYRVAGVDPETQVAYQGLCDIDRREEGVYVMKRMIGGETVEATLRVEVLKNHEGNSLGEHFIAEYEVDGETVRIVYDWGPANFMVGDNYGLLYGRVQSSRAPRRTVLEGFEMLVPTTEGSSEDFEEKVRKELEKLRSEGAEDEDPSVERAERVLEAIAPNADETQE